jgi:hypothetical protein
MALPSGEEISPAASSGMARAAPLEVPPTARVDF